MSTRHEHAHRHSIPHPDAIGRQISVEHDHPHAHDSRLQMSWTQHSPFHKNHKHTPEQEAELRKQRGL